MKPSFIFYSSFDEALRELPDRSRLKIYDAITDYALRGVDTKFTGIEKAVFALIKPQLQANNQRYENGVKGGRPKKNQNETDGFENKKTTVSKNKNQNETDGYFSKKPNENVNENVNVIPPFYSPQGVEKEKTAEDLFFELYPKYAKDRAKMRVDVDYNRLIEEFEKSRYLRSLYTVKQINENYPLIINGDFRDQEKAEKPKDERVEAINAKAERERFYAERRALAESKPERVKVEMMKDRKYFEINGRLSALEIELAKAQINDDERMEAQLTAEKEELLEQRAELLKKHKYTEADLVPKYQCEKCQDTGWQEDGKACDCYVKGG